MRTRCIRCLKDAEVKDLSFIEQRGAGNDPDEPVLLRGSICEDCATINWAFEAILQPRSPTPYKKGAS